jgi:heme-binding protein
MKHLRHILLFAGLGLAVIQFLPVRRGSNPAVIPGHTIEASLNVPAPVENILQNACKDCHSHETRWPWYASVAPLSWMVARDVEKARQAMDLSEWTEQAGARPGMAMGTLMAACAGVEGQRMPPAGYRRMHPEARLTAAQVNTLCGWATAETRVLRKQARSRRTLALNR